MRLFPGSTISAPVGAVAGAGSWLDAYPDDAIVMDFQRNRYAMPALDGSSNPILTRVGGVFPKRIVTAADVLNISRAALPDEEFTETLWSAYSTSSGWSALGGDGLGVGVPRLESWLGTRGLYVEPSQRFNRILNAESLPGLPRTSSMSRGTMAYTLSWVGNDDLILTVSGHPEANQTLTARSADPHGLNWGFVPIISGWNGNVTVITAAGNPGCVAHSLNSDTQSSAAYRPPTTMIATAAHSGGGGVHTERGPEHVRFSDAVMTILKHPGGSNHRIRTGTLIVDQQQLMEPLASGRRIVLGGGDPADGASWGPSYFAFHESGGAYTARFQTGDHNGDLSFTVTAEQARSRMKMGLVIRYSASTPWTNLKRAAITGQAASTTADNNRGMEGNAAFWLNSSATNDADDGPGLNAGGMGVFHSITWSPEEKSEAALLAAVA